MSGEIQYFMLNNKWFEDIGGLRDVYGLCQAVFSVLLKYQGIVFES